MEHHSDKHRLGFVCSCRCVCVSPAPVPSVSCTPAEMKQISNTVQSDLVGFNFRQESFRIALQIISAFGECVMPLPRFLEIWTCTSSSSERNPFSWWCCGSQFHYCVESPYSWCCGSLQMSIMVVLPVLLPAVFHGFISGLTLPWVLAVGLTLKCLISDKQLTQGC